MADRYVVARHCFAGIGDHLSCLAGAWWFAKRTDRVLVVDWRGSRFNSDPNMRRNCFHQYFEPRRSLGGVSVIADDAVRDLDYPAPIWPEKWTHASLAGRNHLTHTASEIDAVNRIVTSDEDLSQPTVVFNQWIEPSPPRQAVRAFLAELQPIEAIRAEAEQFRDEQIGPVPAVAIHLRHGNGENIGTRASYWLGPVALIRQLMANARNDMHRPGLSGRFSDNMPPSLVGTPSQAGAERRFCRRVAAEFHALSRDTGLTDAVPVLFCDAAPIAGVLSEFLPTLRVLPKELPGRGDGPLHQLDAASIEYSEESGIKSGTVADTRTWDMFVELELMRRCHGLVYMDSWFSLLTRMTLDESRVRLLRPNAVNASISKLMNRLTA